MRFMILVRANDETEAGVLPTEEDIAAMMKFNEAMVDAGIMLAGDGLHPSSNGTRVRFSRGTMSVIDGPFPTKEVIAGYWIIQVGSREEAIEWAKRCPARPDEEIELEIRQIYDADEFGEGLTPELRAAEERLAQRIAEQHG
ncbi:YciI family protein [Sphaerobacter sp.]|uniref:YciI family protein n=1 Tax=Sphaerobacter sp. TaxID=2099654 RepID=UPI001DE36899|nr:YciI family protein [Sphaerobacter sp.]